MPAIEPTYDVFVSHKSEHKPWVEWLSRALQSCKRSVFLDHWNLIPGENWLEGLHRGLECSRSAVLVATPEVVNSGWVRQEYAALQRRRQSASDFRLIPIVFGDIPNLPFLKDLQAVDFRDPARYRESFHRLLCGLEGREPGGEACLPCEIPAPPPLRPQTAASAAPGERAFLQRVVKRFMRASSPPLMLLARGQRYQGPVIAALLDMLRGLYKDDQLLRITPPYSERVADAEYFEELGRQCRFTRKTPDSTVFTAAFEGLLEGGRRAVLLVTGFEHANRDCRRQLAGALRTLTERYVDQLRVVLCGGQKLAQQRYGEADLSFLSHADVEEWPDPNAADVLAWQAQEFAELPLDQSLAEDLLQSVGAHPGLIRWCLARWEDSGGTPVWSEWAYACTELWETWHRLKSRDVPQLREALDRDSFGPPLAWPTNVTARGLFWNDLLASRGRSLGWRAEVVRQVGREVLG